MTKSGRIILTIYGIAAFFLIQDIAPIDGFAEIKTGVRIGFAAIHAAMRCDGNLIFNTIIIQFRQYLIVLFAIKEIVLLMQGNSSPL